MEVFVADRQTNRQERNLPVNYGSYRINPALMYDTMIANGLRQQTEASVRRHTDEYREIRTLSDGSLGIWDWHGYWTVDGRYHGTS